MSFLINQIRDQKIIEMEVNLEEYIKEKGISESMMIYSMYFDKSVFAKKEEVKEYLNDKYQYDAKIEEQDGAFLAVLIPVSQMDMDSSISVDLRRGVVANAADFMPVMSFEEVMFNDKGEINFSSKFETINLHEGLPHIIEIARVAEGEHPTYGKLQITQEHLESMEKNFRSKVTGVDLAVNEDHRKNEAFGWFKDVFLSFDKQTLYGQVQWNSKGTQALSEKEYRYFSPEFRFNYVHPHSGEEHGPTLLGGALTNYPFLKMEAITQLNNKLETKDEKVKDKTIELSVHNEVIVELNAKIADTQGKLDASEARNVELDKKVKELKEEIELSSKKAAHEKLFNEGKINAAQLVALNEGKGMLEVIALNEPMNLEPKGVIGNKKEELVELSDGEKKIAEALGLTAEEFRAVN